MKSKKISKLFYLSFILIFCILIFTLTCKNPSGPGIDFNLRNWYIMQGMAAGPGYTGNITYGDSNCIWPTNFGGQYRVFTNQGTTHYRIPALLTLPNGDILAFADKRYNGAGDLPNQIEVMVRKSTNNGTNFNAEKRITPPSASKKDGHGDTAVVLDKKTGHILALVAAGQGFLKSTPHDPIRIKVIRSKDNGDSWSEPIDITSQVYGDGCEDPTRRYWYAAFVTSGNGLQLSTGRIIFVINVRENQQTAGSTFKNYALYSDDGGKSWSVSKSGPQNNYGGNESKIVELVDGRLLMSTRPNSGNKRMHSYSSDGGETWTKSEPKSDITVASSNGDMIYYTSTKNGWDKNRIIHFIPTSTVTVSGEGQYNGRTGPASPLFYYSYDDGQTFTRSQDIRSGQQAGYSSLAVLHDGSIGVLFEDKSWGGPIKFMRVNFEWLTRNKDKGPTKKSSN